MKIIGIGFIAFVLVVLQCLIYKKYWDKNLLVSVFFQQDGISEGEEGEVIEIIENRKRLPITMLKVKFQTSRYLGFFEVRKRWNRNSHPLGLRAKRRVLRKAALHRPHRKTYCWNSF